MTTPSTKNQGTLTSRRQRPAGFCTILSSAHIPTYPKLDASVPVYTTPIMCPQRGNFHCVNKLQEFRITGWADAVAIAHQVNMLAGA